MPTGKSKFSCTRTQTSMNKKYRLQEIEYLGKSQSGTELQK